MQNFWFRLLPELIAVVRGSRPGGSVAIVGAETSTGTDRFTDNALVESVIKEGHRRWVIPCGTTHIQLAQIFNSAYGSLR